VPTDVLLFAFLLALPSCWFSLRHRSREEARMQAARVVTILPLALAAFWAYGILVVVWELVSGVPQYRMRLVKDEVVAIAALGFFYYLLRAAFEFVIHTPVPPAHVGE
jgi:hypothetical protein